MLVFQTFECQIFIGSNFICHMKLEMAPVVGDYVELKFNEQGEYTIFGQDCIMFQIVKRVFMDNSDVKLYVERV